MSITTLQHKLVKIKNQRQCIMCLRKFEPKTPMYYNAVVMDLDFQQYYTCIACDSIAGISFGKYSTYEFSEGWVADELDEGETPEDFLKRINQNN